MATDGYYLNTLIDVASTLLDWTTDAIKDLREFVDDLAPEEEETGQPKEERDWRE